MGTQSATQPVSLGDSLDRLTANIERAIVGKREVVNLLLVALLSEGHVLIEDVPGTGKTTLARALACSITGTFRRIQFTPDLLPSDVTGTSIFNQQTSDFEYRPGPILANIVLADEINRATPRTQSSLLEAMEERSVTVDGITYLTPRPFMVLATQNPVELEGTFPLPEAQLDRFMLRVGIGYPSQDEEEEILIMQKHGPPLERLESMVGVETVLQWRDRVAEIHVSADLRGYITRLVRATRERDAIELGVSPRGTLALYRASQALALLRGRAFVTPDDVKHLALSVLAHRVIPSTDARLRGRSSEELVTEVMAAVAVPVETP